MLIEFARSEAASQYNSSYFNRAKIRMEHVEYLRQIGPYVFREVITIVNKLKLIRKFYSQPETVYHENHISLKVKEILSSCESNKRSDNSNFIKFKKIIDFDDREGLVMELGKLLRGAWARQKNDEQQRTVEEKNR